MRTVRTCATVVAFFSTSAIACHDSTAPATGTIEVTVRSTGDDIDRDGYLANVDSRVTQRVGASGTIAFGGVPTGNHTVRLDSLASNCTVEGDNLRSVSVVADVTVRVDFPVACITRMGAVQLTIHTSGSRPDPDGYRLSVDGGPERLVATNETIDLADMHEGDHRLVLSDIASNCTLSGSNERTVAVGFPGTTLSTFLIVCVGPGSLMVTAATTGIDLDPDGYFVTISSGWYYGPSYGATVPANGSVLLEEIEPGAYSIAVTGRAANCELAGSSPPEVRIYDGALTSVSVNIVCFGRTTLTITSATTGVDPDPDGYVVNVYSLVDGRNSRSATVPANGSVSISDMVGGRYSLAVTGRAANCELAGTNPRDIVVDRDAPTSLSLNVVCLPVRRLAFANGSDGDIYTINSNGTDARRLTTNSARDEDPAWSPDASKLAFATNRDGVFRIYVMNADGSDQRPLTADGAPSTQPAWSPDGQRIAFVRGREAAAEIYVMRTDGTDTVRVGSSTGYDGDPAWSPDGKKIAFRSNRTGNLELYVMNADGSGVTRLTTTGVEVGEPAWSPNGARIVFPAQQCDFYYGCYSDLYVINANGSGVSQLTAGSNASSPAWSPDGTWIAFVGTACQYSQCADGLSMVKADGTAGGTIWAGNAAQPAWRP